MSLSLPTNGWTQCVHCSQDTKVVDTYYFLGNKLFLLQVSISISTCPTAPAASGSLLNGKLVLQILKLVALIKFQQN